MMTREEIIYLYIKGKDVLDIGSVDEDGRHLFWKFLKQYTKSITGIDLRPSEDPAVVYGNMESYDFGKKFDVIIAGDVLIQTDNQGLFLDNARKHLADDGYLLITLPNAKWPTVFFRPSKFQTGWHDRYTLEQIIERHGLKVVSVFYYCGNRHNLKLLRKFITFKKSMVAVCIKK